MNNAIRHTWIVSVALFLSLFVALSLIQVALTDTLNADPKNTRQQIATAGAPRGAITVDGSPIAESVPSDHGQYDYERVYHDAELYSGITGFFSAVGSSSSLLEQHLDDYLSGQSDSQFFDRITALFTGDDLRGAQVELTIDGELQQMAYEMIPDDQRGTIIVQDVRSGDIVTMASKPSYDTNRLAVHDYEEFEQNSTDIQESTDGRAPFQSTPLNRTIAPGSTFKIIDTLAMLESGDYEPDDEVDVPQEYELPGSTNLLPNFASGICDQREEAELTWVFAQSCNTSFAESAVELGDGPIRESAEAFGWNQEGLSIPLPVSTSQFPEISDEAVLALSSIGQSSVTATPLQMNMVAAAVANDGTMMHPHLVDTIRGTDLQILSQTEPEVLNEVMSSSTASDITDMMVETVEDGTGQRAASSRFDVAAKTGTAETGSDDETVHSWITGFAPADDPQYAVTVVYENVESASQGGELTGPQMLAMLEAVIEE